MKWNDDKLAELSTADLKQLLENASKRNAVDLVAACERMLSERLARSQQRKTAPRRKETGEIVLEYHFVCRNYEGVQQDADGSFWSCSWVVAEDVLRKSIEYGCYLALHQNKAQPSYVQGKVIGFRRVDNFEGGETTSRLDFHVRPDGPPLLWAGTGNGEKGYKRLKISGNPIESEEQPS